MAAAMTKTCAPKLEQRGRELPDCGCCNLTAILAVVSTSHVRLGHGFLRVGLKHHTLENLACSLKVWAQWSDIMHHERNARGKSRGSA